MTRDLYLAIDVGTGSIRAALVDRRGRILAIRHREHEQIVPRHGWSEQRPTDWWGGTVASVRDVLGQVADAPSRVAALCACGQMHGTVLVDDDGRLTRDTAPLWNDKRTLPQVEAFSGRVPEPEALRLAANLPAPPWPAFKLLWLQENDPRAVARASTVLMPKDWINLRLTGLRAGDWTEASMSFLMDPATRGWSPDLLHLTGVPARLLPPLRDPSEVLGPLAPEAAALLGLAAGLPVLVGGGDYPVALLGSGVMAPGMGSDVTGTSTILTVLGADPVLDPAVSNVMTVEGHWGALTLLDAGGDAVRWARRAFHENRLTHEDIDEAAARADPGAGGLLFLPYLAGERFGDRNARAQFFGLTAAHGLPELHRAVLEGVAFSVRHRLAIRPDRIVAAGGGARSDLWLRIKASLYRAPYLVPREPECGVVGLAAMMAAATGDAPDLTSAVSRMVTFDREIVPDPAWADHYDGMMPVYSDLYEAARAFYARLEAITAPSAPATAPGTARPPASA